jgi:putative ABC transport system permease protein
VIPGVALDELWEGLAYGEEALRLVAVFVVLVGLTGMLVSVYNSLNERRREMAILRSLGATPRVIFGLLVTEAGILVGSGAALGVVLTRVLLVGIQPIVANQFGFYLAVDGFSSIEIIYFCATLISGLLLGAIPAWRAYRQSLSDGLVIRL